MERDVKAILSVKIIDAKEENDKLKRVLSLIEELSLTGFSFISDIQKEISDNNEAVYEWQDELKTIYEREGIVYIDESIVDDKIQKGIPRYKPIPYKPIFQDGGKRQ